LENTSQDPIIVVDGLTARFGENIVFERVSFTVNRGEILVILGGSGCGKSTLLKHLIGLYRPAAGRVLLNGIDIMTDDERKLHSLKTGIGVLFQSGALFGSMTLAENITTLLEGYANLDPLLVKKIVSLKLALVGLAGFEDYYPSEISGGMKKRAGLARAMALDPEILFFDEPSAGLDPISAHLLDDLILELRDSLGATVVVVTHELASIFAIGNNSVFLDGESKTMLATGDPKKLLAECGHPTVRNFLTRGEAKITGLDESKDACLLSPG